MIYNPVDHVANPLRGLRNSETGSRVAFNRKNLINTMGLFCSPILIILLSGQKYWLRLCHAVHSMVNFTNEPGTEPIY